MSKNLSTSGLSRAIKEALSSYEAGDKSHHYSKPKEFTVKVANSLQAREKVFHLAYQVYLDKGFIKKNAQEWLVNNYDAVNETVILMVEDEFKQIAGTLTLVFDNSIRLPAEKIYSEEINLLRAKGERLLETSRLAINPEYRNTKEVLQLLLNYMLIYAHYVRKYSAMIIEVNPRHKTYYKSLMKFDEIGAEKSCPFVQNAPAVLLHLPLERYQSEIHRCTKLSDKNTKERSLYPYFLQPEQEKLVAHYLQRQCKPMTSEEKIYFGFSESGKNKAVCLV